MAHALDMVDIPTLHEYSGTRLSQLVAQVTGLMHACGVAACKRSVIL
jgi:hypothetical protein